MEKVYIFGHRNPDTDSVTSAIAMEYLKKSLGIYAEARVLGELNDETRFVLDKFNVKYPKYLNDVKLQIKDIKYHKDLYQNNFSSIEDLYHYMNINNVTGVPIVDGNKRFEFIITAKMLLKEIFNMNNNLLYTSYDNILETLKGSSFLRFDEEIKGKITAVSYKSTTFIETFDFLEDDILIVGDRHSIIEAAVMKKIKLLVITGNGLIKDEHVEIAKNNRVNIIKTPFDTFTAVRKILLSNYVKKLNAGERAYTISENDYYDDFVEKTTELGFNNYPVVDKKGICKGLIRITDINKKKKKKVILVDHNESEQSVIGLEEAEILEVIDHHKIGDISTNNPINFRNMAVGSTNTIVYYLYKENRVEIPKHIASLMLAGILSDTLALTSPTTTQKDRVVVEVLEQISGLNYKEFSKEMFNSSLSFDKKNEYDLLTMDVKTFNNGNRSFKVSQIITMNVSGLLEKKDKFIEEINKFRESSRCDYVVLMITDLLSNGTYLLFDSTDLTYNILQRALDISVFQGVYLDGVVSRKKQIIPLLMELE